LHFDTAVSLKKSWKHEHVGTQKYKE
jgi:hypothetical protein